MIFDLDNITVRQLYGLGTDMFEKYTELQKCLKSRNEFAGSEGLEITSLSFAEVCEIKRTFISPTLEGLFSIFQSIFKVSKDKFLRSDVVSYFYALNHLGNSVQQIMEREKLLAPKEDEDYFLMKEAGAERLQVFQELPILLNLAERFATTPEVIETWKYSKVFAILLHDKTTADIRKEFNNLKNQRNGHQ